MQKITYEEMNKARDEFITAQQEFNHKYYDFLETALEEAGFLNKLVRIKDKDLTGQFKIYDSPSSRQPWEIKFYPLTKSSEVSMKSKHLNSLYLWEENELVEHLLKIAEVVGEA